MNAGNARDAVRHLTPAQMKAALMCLWVADPTAFWKAIDAANDTAPDGAAHLIAKPSPPAHISARHPESGPDARNAPPPP